MHLVHYNFSDENPDNLYEGSDADGGWRHIYTLKKQDNSEQYLTLPIVWCLLQFKATYSGIWIRMKWGNSAWRSWKQLY